jgi:high-affinity nickel-transport protein
MRAIGPAPGGVKARITALYTLLLGFHGVAWVLLFLAATRYPQLGPLGLVAYTLGLRHAVDADHIAAIDNTTRKLLGDGQKPVAVGFFFSLGHATVVVVLSVLLALSTAYVQQHLPALKAAGAVVGTLISSLFLLLIGLINLVGLSSLYKMWRQVSRGGGYDDGSLEECLGRRGLVARLLKPMLKVVGNSWTMYPIGLLFGLGFDTASQIALYGFQGSALSKGMPLGYILVLPALFTAGMSLLDTTDGVLMLGAYGWAFVRPIRKLYYNMTLTLISVLIALGVGGLEALQVLSIQLKWTGGLWTIVNDGQRLNSQTLGFYIIGTFILSWGVSIALYKWRGYDDRAEASSPSRSPA